MIDPPSCGPDPRARCAAYVPGQVYRVVVALGDSLVLQFPDDSVAMTVAGARVQENMEHSAPTEWQSAKEHNLVYLTPLRADMPTTSMAVTVAMPDGSIVVHVLELNVRAGAVTKDTPDTMFSLVFSYPAMEAAKAKADRRAKREAWKERHKNDADEAQERLATDRLQQDIFYGQSRNTLFKERGDAQLKPARVSDNGLEWAITYSPQSSLPVPFALQSGEDCDGKHEATLDFNVPLPGLMLIHADPAIICLRQNHLVYELQRAAPLPVNVPGTGTVSPEVVRTMRSAAR